jgi:hypothetical protein
MEAHRALRLGLSASLLVALGARLLAVYDLLPQTVASHFDASGYPDAHQSRAGFVALCGVVTLGTFALFALLPPVLRRTPADWINLPNREYWLRPERRDGAIERLCVYLDWFAFATLAVLVVAMELAVQANLSGRPLRGGLMWLLLCTYAFFSIAWLVLLMRAFALPGPGRTPDRA